MAPTEDRLSETFSALANPTRRAILARLAQGQANVQELAAPFDMTLPAVSRHIKVLERAGLIRQSQQAQYRPCELDARPLRDVSDWADEVRCVWETSFQRMDEYLRVLSSKTAHSKEEEP